MKKKRAFISKHVTEPSGLSNGFLTNYCNQFFQGHFFLFIFVLHNYCKSILMQQVVNYTKITKFNGSSLDLLKGVQ